MSMNDLLSDMLTRIRNGQQARLSVVSAPASNLSENVLKVLAEEGYIRGYSRNEEDSAKPQLNIELKYHDGEPVIKELKRKSKPGRRVYTSVKEMPRVHNGLGMAIISTPKGVMSDYQARVDHVGGEVLCSVF